MNAGRSAPRYQQLALLYPRSKTLQANLCEYLIVVVRICHGLLKFSKQSYFGQLTASLSDADVKQYETELETWAASIREDVFLLMGQKMDDEAKENFRFRSITSRFTDTAAYRNKIKKRLRILDACSTFDHQTPWKQARKIGNTTLFLQAPQYEEWKNAQSPGSHSRTLIYSAKLGAGKSVLLANMVDDLNLYAEEGKFPVLYYFCRHDIPESLQSRTVIGSLVRQLLSRMPDLPSPTNRDAHEVANHEMDLDQLLEYFYRVYKSKLPCYLVLDGLDECGESDRKMILAHCRTLQQRLQLILCISFRLEADSRLQLSTRQFESPVVLTIPTDNPEIVAFIDAELEARVIDKELNIGDPAIILEIREALLNGAQGMFLWVALQISSLCAEKTDEKIRSALMDLPKDLSETFSRILQRAAVHDRIYQRPILELVAVACRPLMAEELREALSVIPGNTDWDPAKLVNDIYSTLACCGSLITVDEEEGTIRLVHHSIKQYLVGDTNDGTESSFDLEDANRRMGRAILTYLRYNVFQTQLSTMRIPKWDAGTAPKKIISSINTATKSQTLALELLRSRMKLGSGSRSEHDIGQVLANESRQFKPRLTHEVFAFYSYAQTYWLVHTRSISEEDGFSHKALLRLLKEHMSRSSSDLISSGHPGPDRHFSILWALQNSHLSLLQHLLRTTNLIKAVTSIYINLKVLVTSPNPPVWHKEMSTRLLVFATLHGLPTSSILIRHLLHCGATVSYRNYTAVATAISLGNQPALKLFLAACYTEDPRAILKGLDIDPLLEASRSSNGGLVSFLESRGADANQFTGSKSPLFYVLDNMRQHTDAPRSHLDAEDFKDFASLVQAATQLSRGRARIEFPPESRNTLTRFLITFVQSATEPSDFTNSIMCCFNRDQCSEILLDCCAFVDDEESGHNTNAFELASTVLGLGADADFYEKNHGQSCLSLAVGRFDQLGDSMIRLLLGNGASALTKHHPTTRSVLEYCLVAKKTACIELFLLHGLERSKLRQAVTDLGLLHLRIEEYDYDQIEYLCGFAGADIDAPNPGRRQNGQTPLLMAIACDRPDAEPAAVVWNIALRGADLDHPGATNTISPLQAALRRVTDNGRFHQDSAVFLRVARGLVSFGAQFDDKLVEQVVHLCVSLFVPNTLDKPVELDSPVKNVPPPIHDLRRVNLHQCHLEDSVLSLLEDLLRDLVGRRPPSTKLKMRLVHSLKHGIVPYVNRAIENSAQTRVTMSQLQAGHFTTIVDILSSSRDLSLSCTQSYARLPSSTLEDEEYTKSATEFFTGMFFTGWGKMHIPPADIYPLLKHGRRSHDMVARCCRGMPDSKWKALIESGITVAVSQGDDESVRAGLGLLMERGVFSDYNPDGDAKLVWQKLNALPEAGVCYELESTEYINNAAYSQYTSYCQAVTPATGPVELSADNEVPLPSTPLGEGGFGFEYHQLVQNNDSHEAAHNIQETKRKKSRWWRGEP